MFKAVVTDLDGTLLNKDHFLSTYTKNIINKFLDKGYKLYIATGRVERGARLIADQFSHSLSLITTNGARIIDEKGKEIYSVTLNKKCKDFILNLDYKKYGKEIFINGYSGTDWFVISDEYKDFYSKRRVDKTFGATVIDIEEFKKKDFNKLFFIGSFENLKKIREVLKENISKDANIDFVSENSLEIFDISANKANASLKLLEKDGINPDEVIAFGDGLNDYFMLKLFKNSFIMSNALQELKDLLPEKEIIDDSHSDAVAKKIEEVFNLWKVL